MLIIVIYYWCHHILYDNIGYPSNIKAVKNMIGLINQNTYLLGSRYLF